MSSNIGNIILSSIVLRNKNEYETMGTLKKKIMKIYGDFEDDEKRVIANIGTQLFRNQLILYDKYTETNNQNEKNKITYNGYIENTKYNMREGEMVTKYHLSAHIDLLKLRTEQNKTAKKPDKYSFSALYQRYLINLKYNIFNKDKYPNETGEEMRNRIMKELNNLVRQINTKAIVGGNKLKLIKLNQKIELNKLKIKQKEELNKLKAIHKKNILNLKNTTKKNIKKNNLTCCNCNRNFSSKAGLTNHQHKCN